MKSAKYLAVAIFALLIFASGMVLFWYLSSTDLLRDKRTIINIELTDSLQNNASNETINSRILESIASSKALYENKLTVKCDVQKVGSYSMEAPKEALKDMPDNSTIHVKTALTLSCQ